MGSCSSGHSEEQTTARKVDNLDAIIRSELLNLTIFLHGPVSAPASTPTASLPIRCAECVSVLLARTPMNRPQCAAFPCSLTLHLNWFCSA